ncbi:MAG: DUF692 domain-containing protein [Rhizobiales bacterium]|nr:DUF692 domain-containing protein [Hyphomicrobiales bacterium]
MKSRRIPRSAHDLRLPIFPTPLRSGAGFKPEHLGDILADARKVGFFEVHAENYMGDGGAPHAMLDRLRADYPVFLHGVAMSIGGEGPLDKAHLARFRRLVDRYEPHVVSEHLAWSTHDTAYFNDLLPVPYTRAVLARVVDHIDEVQNALGRTLLLENPSTYVTFDSSEMSETQFILEVARQSGCELLLDVNNVFVSATNHDYAPEDYLADFPLHLVREIHLAGHATDQDDAGHTLLIDAHDRPVAAEVWNLYEKVIAVRGPIPTLIEWDNDVPEWSVLKSEADAADVILSRHASDAHPELRHAS